MKIINQLQRGYKKFEIFISIFTYWTSLCNDLFWGIISSNHYIIDSLLFFWWRCLKLNTTGDVFCLSISFFCDVISYLLVTPYTRQYYVKIWNTLLSHNGLIMIIRHFFNIFFITLIKQVTLDYNDIIFAK